MRSMRSSVRRTPSPVMLRQIGYISAISAIASPAASRAAAASCSRSSIIAAGRSVDGVRAEARRMPLAVEIGIGPVALGDHRDRNRPAHAEGGIVVAHAVAELGPVRLAHHVE